MCGRPLYFTHGVRCTEEKSPDWQRVANYYMASDMQFKEVVDKLAPASENAYVLGCNESLTCCSDEGQKQIFRSTVRTMLSKPQFEDRSNSPMMLLMLNESQVGHDHSAGRSNP